MSATSIHCMSGLEFDNPLAFFALLGVLRALEADDGKRDPAAGVRCRARWDLQRPPLRPTLVLGSDTSREDLLDRIARGVDLCAEAYRFDGRKDLDFPLQNYRELLREELRSAKRGTRQHIDLLAALASDGSAKPERGDPVEPTPFCLMSGQGHQHFLERLAAIPHASSPPPRRCGASAISAPECISEALFEPWHHADVSPSFRWDPVEGVRYALMAGDPTLSKYKVGTQHGANRLAAIGLSALTVVPSTRSSRVRLSVIGGEYTRSGFSFAWPIWNQPATFGSIRALIAHPDLRSPGKLAHLGVTHVMTARKVSIGKYYMSFARAEVLAPDGE